MKSPRNKIIALIFMLPMLMWACSSLIFDSMDDCPQGVNVKFYSQTICDTDSSYLGQVNSLIVFAFDENNKLSAIVKKDTTLLDKDFEIYVPVVHGLYTFVAWTGVNEKFELSDFRIGSTNKRDLMLSLQSVAGQAEMLTRTDSIWQGASDAVYLPDPAEHGTVTKDTYVNMREVSNRVNIRVEFDSVSMKGYDVSDIYVKINSANTQMNIDRSISPNSNTVELACEDSLLTEKYGIWRYTTLDLVPINKNNLTVSYTGNGKNETVFQGDLIASILQLAIKNGISLQCTNDFDVKIVINDYCATCFTNFSCGIYVNNWLVHSYSTKL